MFIPKTRAIIARLRSGQVHITPQPPPRNLRESKLILTALQRFGEVSAFRNLKYDVANKFKDKDKSILAIFESTEAAQRAINCSPLTVMLPDISSERSSSVPPSSSTSTNSYDDDNEVSAITCIIEPSHHGHAISLRRNRYFATYNIYRRSSIYQDLTSKETGIPLEELADTLASKKVGIPRRVKNRILEGSRRRGAGGLMRLWQDGAEAEKGLKAKEWWEPEGRADGDEAIKLEMEDEAWKELDELRLHEEKRQQLQQENEKKLREQQELEQEKRPTKKWNEAGNHWLTSFLHDKKGISS